MNMLLFASEGFVEWLAVAVASIGVLISVGGWYITHQMVVKHDERKTAVDLMRNIAEHSHLSWNCHISLNNVYWRIKDNDSEVEKYRTMQYKLR